MARRPEWSRSFVTHLLRNTRSLHFSSAAPYLGELFAPDLHDRISHPAEVIDHRCAPPLATLIGGKPYFIPGSTDDLILYVSSVAACAAAILHALPGEAIQDYGPPSTAELARGLCGDMASMRRAWRTMEGMVQQRLHHEGGTLLVADIAQCCASMNPTRLHALLRQADAEPSAVAHLERMHRAWHHAGCRGLPLTGVFPLQIKPYLAEVDHLLQKEGVDFFRRIRSGGGTNTKTPVAAMGLRLFKMISLQPRRCFGGPDGGDYRLPGAVWTLRVVSPAWSNAISSP